MPRKKSRFASTPESAEMTKLWKTDRSEFPRPLLACLESGDDLSITYFLKSLSPDSRGVAEEAVMTASDTLPLGNKVIARLFAIPVLVHPGDGCTPDTDGLSSALSWSNSGLLPRGPYAVILPFYVDPDAVTSLTPSGRKALVRAIATGHPVASSLSGYQVPKPALDGRGSPAGLLGVVVGDQARTKTFLDFDADTQNLNAFKKAALMTGGGLVDIENPDTLDCLVGAFEDRGSWLVRSSGAVDEICEFVLAAEIEATEDGINCEAERSQGLLTVTLRDRGGNILDKRAFPSGGIVISVGEAMRVLEAKCRTFTIRDVAPVLHISALQHLPHIRTTAPSFCKPSLKIVGGKLIDRPEFIIPESSSGSTL